MGSKRHLLTIFLFMLSLIVVKFYYGLCPYNYILISLDITLLHEYRVKKSKLKFFIFKLDKKTAQLRMNLYVWKSFVSAPNSCFGATFANSKEDAIENLMTQFQGAY